MAMLRPTDLYALEPYIYVNKNYIEKRWLEFRPRWQSRRT